MYERATSQHHSYKDAPLMSAMLKAASQSLKSCASSPCFTAALVNTHAISEHRFDALTHDCCIVIIARFARMMVSNVSFTFAIRIGTCVADGQ
jgi:hypothetical protein